MERIIRVEECGGCPYVYPAKDHRVDCGLTGKELKGYLEGDIPFPRSCPLEKAEDMPKPCPFCGAELVKKSCKGDPFYDHFEHDEVSGDPCIIDNFYLEIGFIDWWNRRTRETECL